MMLSFRAWLCLLVLVAQLPFVALVAVLVLQPLVVTSAGAMAAAIALVTGLVLAVLVARRLTAATDTLDGAAHALMLGEGGQAGHDVDDVRELSELGETIATAARVRREAEQRLRAGEERLITLLGAIPAPVIVVDGSRRVTVFNRAAETLFGCTATEAVGSPADRFFSQRFMRVIAAHLDGARGRLRALTVSEDAGHPIGFRSDASEFPIDAAVARVDTTAGPMCVLTLRDLSDERRREDERADVVRQAEAARSAAEHAARAAEEARRRLAEAVEALRAIVWEADPTTLDVSHIGRAAETLLGYPVAQWTRPGFWISLIQPDERDAVVRTLRERTAAGHDATLAYRLTAADGRSVWIEHLVTPVRGDDGIIERLRGVMIDVTGRRGDTEDRERLLSVERTARAEAEAAAQRARFLAEASDLLTSSLDHAATLDSLVRLAVPAVADWCVVHLAEPVGGRRLHVAGADGDAGPVAQALERLAPALELQSVLPAIDRVKDHQPLLLTDIGPAWIEGFQLLRQLAPRSVIVVPMIARGRPIGTLTLLATQPDRRYGDGDLALARDLAQRAAIAVDNARVYAEAEGANRAKDQFLATLSHELRTPLTAMLGWVLMLQSGRLNREEAASALASIERNTRLQTQLINDLLDISRIVAGKLQLDRRPVDLRLVIDHALDSVKRATEDKRLTVACAIASDAAWVPGDAVRLEQIVVNLLGNAVKFTPEGGHVEIRLEAEGGFARFTVSDTGQGIDPAELPHVFDSFRQADSSTTRRHGGLGLGLAIVRRLVAMHQGDVQAASAGKGRGATFTVRLPLLPDSARPAPGPVAETRRSRDDGGLPRLDGLRVLVVEDDEDSRLFVESVLSGCGADVRVAASAETALDVLASTYVDVMVSDIGMPGTDGYDLIARVRARERQHGGRIPAIALTAYASEEDRDRALAAGFSAHVAKPVSPAALARAVAELCGGGLLASEPGER